MKKESLYMRKKRTADWQKAQRNLREQILNDLHGMQVSAGLHAWTGNDGQKIVHLAGRLCYIVAFAANQAGFDAEHVDMRILRGMAGALADFAANLKQVDYYRPAIQSGLHAVGRLLPHCHDMHLVLGAAALEGKLDKEWGLVTDDVRQAMGLQELKAIAP